MPKIYSDLPQPVMQALLDETGFEISDEKNADIKLYKSQLPPAPYRLGDILDIINRDAKLITVNGIEFNLAAKTASNGTVTANLTEKETDIIGVLYNSVTPLSREDLLKKIWQYAAEATTNTVETHIYRLRQKLTENFGFEVIDTISGNYFIKND